MASRLPDPSTCRQIASGLIVGTCEDRHVHAWRGIPYAAPPTGARRWRAPADVSPWSGTREMLSYGAMAPQFAGLLAPVDRHLHGHIIGDEDCLSLNVFAPAWTPSRVPKGADRRPVMVWIHGGGSSVGTAASYDVLRQYAAHDDIVVVSVNYRLGVLGWFAHPALHEADEATPEERSGNFGTLDLIAALRWVSNNIAAFGGDPQCVTLFGESAGGQHVLTLLASPLAAGLFHRAIVQSPVTETFGMAEAMDEHDSVFDGLRLTGRELSARLWARAHRHDDLEAVRRRLLTLPAGVLAEFLRGLTPKELLACVQPGTAGIYLGPRPLRDGVVLPAQPLDEVFRSGRWNRVPVIIGSNRDEYRTFLADKPEHSRLLFGKLPLLRHRSAYLLESSYLSEAWRAVHVDAIADAMLDGSHTDVWSYRFDWDEAPAVPWLRPDLLLGAAHGLEMAFAFRDVAGEFDIFGINTPFNRKSRVGLSHLMADAWTSFARTGAPVLSAQSPWLRRTLDHRAPDSLIFDSARDGGVRMAALRDSVLALKQRLMQDGGAIAPALRCQIYARAFLWSPVLRGHGSQAEYQEWCRRFDCAMPAEAFRPRNEI